MSSAPVPAPDILTALSAIAVDSFMVEYGVTLSNIVDIEETLPASNVRFLA